MGIFLNFLFFSCTAVTESYTLDSGLGVLG